ncbi:helix-turn-helix transcriptional regulator [Filimonas effusa]|uniref:AraC family transcriptional regulator n=1 Tax=Filimonas effusa TaxID=2508721 RepID=A0A4Q1D7T6_9BACT|nr:helix-turn-helix transcriptional regulator [Filimonas effusa]RXK85364.1 AraC family transcriptional regulator [Filimonas effusa]
MANLMLQYNCDNYVELVHLLASKMQAPVRDNMIAIPARYGQGYLRAQNLQGGLSVLISDVLCAADIMLERLPGYNSFYVLQFSEVMEEQIAQITSRGNTSIVTELTNSYVMLHNGQMESKNFIPAGTQVRSLLLIFERKHLLQFLEPDVADLFLSNYFSRLVQTGAVEPIDADYRALLDMLLRPSIDHPLPSNYMSNRCMLLLERFILQVMSKTEERPLTGKLSADEVNRLMRVEAKLVKDYTVPPPTIELLSKSAAMSATKLKRDFKLLYGLPIYEYYQRHRMKKARQLLMEGVHSIKEVGIMVGYSNLSHFAVSFKKEFGVLPSEFSVRDAVLPIERID